jgi:hypothetical protein
MALWLSITLHVTETLNKLLKLQLSLKAKANQVTKVWNQIQMKKLENSKCWNHGSHGTFQNFTEVNFGHDSKTWFDPYDQFSHHKNLQNIGGQEAIVLKVKIQLMFIRFWRLRKFPRNCLMFNPLWNFISSSIFRVSLGMSLRWKSNVFRPSWITSCSICYTGRFLH